MGRVRALLADAVREKAAGGILVALGVLFFGWAAAAIIDALLERKAIATSELALRVTDCLMSSACYPFSRIILSVSSLGYRGISFPDGGRGKHRASRLYALSHGYDNSAWHKHGRSRCQCVQETHLWHRA